MAEASSKRTTSKVTRPVQRIPKLLERTLLGDLMETDGFEPDWMLEDWLYARSVHWIAGPPGEGKTWLALWFCARIIKQGGNVLYLDEENTPRGFAERLRLLGCTPEQVDKHFYYARNPGLEQKKLVDLEAVLAKYQPVLTVFDASADFLSIYNAEENSARDITKWISVVVRKPIVEYDGTAVVLDHTPHGALRARGSGAKAAKPEVSYLVTSPERFSRYRVGKLKIVHTKDHEGWLPAERYIRIGMKPSDEFVLEVIPELTANVTRVENDAPTTELLDDEWRNVKYFVDATGLDRETVKTHLNEATKRGAAERRRVGKGPTAPYEWRRVPEETSS